MSVLVGADPEVFVKDNQNRFRSAYGLIPGTKADPYPVKNGAIQVDGMALEFNIDAAETREQFVSNIGSVLAQLAAAVPNYRIVIEPTATFNGNHMRAQPPEALELGCEPDFNAYTGLENPRPDGSTNMRTAAGHVHIGFTEGADTTDPEHMQKCITLVKHLDVFLGHPSLIWDADVKRRQLYGKAGAFRPKPYGVEYRTLSNAWLKHPDLVGYVFDQVQACVDYIKSGERIENTRPERINMGGFHSGKRLLSQHYPFINQPPEVTI